jgi:hypothetical protein
VGGLPPSPEQRAKVVPLGQGVKPVYRAGNYRELEVPEALSRWGAKPPSLVHQFRVPCLLQITKILVTTGTINDQGDALRLRFEVVVAAVELPVPRGELKNRIKTFLGNPLCRGVDELCTELLHARDGFVEDLVKENLERHTVGLSDNLELRREDFGLKTENNRLKKENDRPDCLLDYYMEERRVAVAMCEQRNSALMHYNELQSRSAEVEAIWQ